jgi:hypothetical protein
VSVPLRAAARRVRAERGITLIEVSVILVATVSIVGALLPSITSVVRRAESTAASTAMTDISDQLLQMLVDLNYTGPTIDGVKNGTRVELLVSDGDIPRDVSVTGSASWQSTVNLTTGLTDFIAFHLILNTPRGSAANAYTLSGGNPWRGTYLTGPVDPDPWGNRYAVNVEFLGGSANDVVVYSAGQDEEIDTQYSANPVVAADDDLILLVEA